MTDKITLKTFSSLQNDTSATTDLNSNSTNLISAINNTLSRDGTQPNTMGANLDMNSFHLINLPAPVSNFDAVRFVDVTTIGGGGSISINPLPIGGTTGQVLTKNSNTNFDVGWSAIVSGLNVTSGKTLSATNTLTLSGTDGTTMTFPATSGNVMTDSSTNTLTNKSYNTSAIGNTLQINGTTVSNITGTGNSIVLANGPSIGTPTFTGSITATNLVTNASLAQAAATTLKGNTTSSTANVADFTIQGLTDIGTPSGTLDFLLIFDHTSGTLKKAQPVNVAAANTAGVTSIAGNTGAFTLGAGVANSANIILADATYHRGYLSGNILSGGGSQVLTVTAGVACSDDFSTLMKLPSTFTKAIQTAWAVGTGNGGLDTGAIANSTWYHVYIIERLDTGLVDVLVSTSATAPTMPTNYTVKRRIGSIKTDGSANILAFTQTYDTFVWAVPVQEFNAANPGTSAVNRVLAGSPLGVVCSANLSIADTNTGTGHWQYISPLTATDSTPSVSAFTIGAFGTGTIYNSNVSVLTNTSSQIRTRQSASGVGDILQGTLISYRDFRGQ